MPALLLYLIFMSRYKSVFYLDELVLQPTVRDAAVSNQVGFPTKTCCHHQQLAYTKSQAPEPLLANFGMGNIRAYNQDMNMLTTCNSQERTLQEFVDMGYDGYFPGISCRFDRKSTFYRKKTGLKFVKLWHAGETALVEFTSV